MCDNRGGSCKKIAWNLLVDGKKPDRNRKARDRYFKIALLLDINNPYFDEHCSACFIVRMAERHCFVTMGG